MTGKGLTFGGSLARTGATGFGLLYYTNAMLKAQGDTLTGKKIKVSGAGNVATYAIQKATELGAKVITVSDSNGYIYDPKGIDYKVVKQIKEVERGRIRDYADRVESAEYHGGSVWDFDVDYDIALPCATQNEINKDQAKLIVKDGAKYVCEGANMPSYPDAIAIYRDSNVLYGPAKAANAGGVAVSALEMSQKVNGWHGALKPLIIDFKTSWKISSPSQKLLTRNTSLIRITKQVQTLPDLRRLLKQ